MRRRRFQQTEPGISLLPFMAVLICTMGTMIVILMVVVRQAKVRADTVADHRREAVEATAAEREAKIEQRRVARETFQWRFEHLQQSREQTASDLANQRRQLAHIEDHARRLEDEWKRLAQENETLESLTQNQRLDQDELQRELEASRSQLDAKRADLEVARKEAAEKPRSYAIIPYDGPHGTNRRPIYIECRHDRVILQPEGIVFEGSDFREPLGPGNPLAASLRAIRAHWNRVGDRSGGRDAYPLLIVRPGGAEAYLACRQAMKSWDDEFGYELVADEMQLAFPPADPALGEVLGRTVADARHRQNQELLAALARPGGSGRRQYLRATSSGGGFVVESEPGGFGGGDAADSERQPYSTVARGNGGFARRGPSGDAAGADGEFAAGSARRESAGGAHAASSPNEQNASPAGQPPRGGGGFYGGSAGRPETRTDASAPQGQAQQGMAATPPPGATNRDPRAADNAQQFGGTASNGGGNASQPSARLAETRGRDWALPHAARGATGVTRPIRIVCTADELTIVPQRGSGQSLKVVAMRGSTLEAVDQFVSQLWKHIEDWQMAGPGLYWKPELMVEVAPGGRQRFEQLSFLLEGSGITVKQKAR